MPPIVPYRIAQLQVPGDYWEISPYDYTRRRFVSRFMVSSRSYRNRQAAAAVQLVSVNHPRAVNFPFKATVDTLADNLLWLQRISVTEHATMKTTVPGGTADELRITGTVSADAAGAVPFLPGGYATYGAEVHVRALEWRLGGGLTDVILVATARGDAQGLIYNIESNVVYRGLYWPIFQGG